MKQLVCEMCGGKELVKQDGVFVCQSCGTKYSVEDAKKMMVTIDNSGKLENALKNARRARECNDHEQAQKYYDIVQMEDPENWEATFYSTYYKVMGTSISQATNSIVNVIKIVLKDIKKIDDITQQNEAIKQISTDLFNLASGSYYNAINNYESLTFTEKVNRKESHDIDVSNLMAMLILFGKELVSEFGKNEFTTSMHIKCYETALTLTNNKYYADELTKIEPAAHELTAFYGRKEEEKKNFWRGCGAWILFVFLFALLGALIGVFK
ncbi:MAG: TFIIB-type zinc finger domain-containing protein [Fibromonadales bacterium]|nr:TFIIB-type zinc finger domain-containing protein [Fibromonadales bacterium]